MPRIAFERFDQIGDEFGASLELDVVPAPRLIGRLARTRLLEDYYRVQPGRRGDEQSDQSSSAPTPSDSVTLLNYPFSAVTERDAGLLSPAAFSRQPGFTARFC